MTRRQRLAIRMPVGCTVVCLDDSDPVGLLAKMVERRGRPAVKHGVAAKLKRGARYVVAAHEPEVEVPLLRLRGWHNSAWLAPIRFRRVA